MHVVALVGSLRKESLNMQLAHTLQERYKDTMTVAVADIGALPHYNQDEELDPPAVVKEFKDSLKKADAVIIITPEYNWSIPGVLKNALDWASRVDRVLAGKPVLPMGVSMGMLGTIRAQLHLREILTSMGVQAKVLPPGGNEILVNAAGDKFENGRLVHEETLAFIDDVVAKFVDFVKEASPASANV